MSRCALALTASALAFVFACGDSPECQMSADCGDGVCDSNRCRMAGSCKELHAERPDLPSGRYDLDLGLGAWNTSCDMTTDGGGWTALLPAEGQTIAAGIESAFDVDSG